MDNLISETLSLTANLLVANYKGLLAMDESIPTCNKRLRETGIPETAEYRRKYRELIITTPALERYISGAILSDETIMQLMPDGQPITAFLQQKGIVPGIKVDLGTKPMALFPDEKVTEGIDKLQTRLKNYHRMGARFAKWRAITRIGLNLPTSACLQTNAELLALYAAECQEAGLVPVVEPEVLMDGDHSMETCATITLEFLHQVFIALYKHRVQPGGMLLKPNMILPGSNVLSQPSATEVAVATLSCLKQVVPAAVPGIVFLSGGQPAALASERLNAMNIIDQTTVPWRLSFSFSRAILQPALHVWKGNGDNTIAAQQILLHRAACNHAACKASYFVSMENEPHELMNKI